MVDLLTTSPYSGLAIAGAMDLPDVRVGDRITLQRGATALTIVRESDETYRRV